MIQDMSPIIQDIICIFHTQDNDPSWPMNGTLTGTTAPG